MFNSHDRKWSQAHFDSPGVCGRCPSPLLAEGFRRGHSRFRGGFIEGSQPERLSQSRTHDSNFLVTVRKVCEQGSLLAGRLEDKPLDQQRGVRC